MCGGRRLQAADVIGPGQQGMVEGGRRHRKPPEEDDENCDRAGEAGTTPLPHGCALRRVTDAGTWPQTPLGLIYHPILFLQIFSHCLSKEDTSRGRLCPNLPQPGASGLGGLSPCREALPFPWLASLTVLQGQPWLDARLDTPLSLCTELFVWHRPWTWWVKGISFQLRKLTGT